MGFLEIQLLCGLHATSSLYTDLSTFVKSQHIAVNSKTSRCCYTEIVDTVIAGNQNYLVTLKDNQSQMTSYESFDFIRGRTLVSAKTTIKRGQAMKRRT